MSSLESSVTLSPTTLEKEKQSSVLELGDNQSQHTQTAIHAYIHSFSHVWTTQSCQSSCTPSIAGNLARTVRRCGGFCTSGLLSTFSFAASWSLNRSWRALLCLIKCATSNQMRFHIKVMFPGTLWDPASCHQPVSIRYKKYVLQ